MKRLFIVFTALALAFSTQAQVNQNSNYIGLNVGGGMNTLTFSPTDGSWSPKLGFLGELRYIHFFGDHFGIGFGVQYDLSRSGVTYNYVEVTNGLVHPDNGLSYNASTGYHDWKESQKLSFLSVPLEFYWRTALGQRWSILVGFGAQLDFPMKGSFSADEGTYEVQGYFPATGVTYRNLPAYGFTVYNADEEGDIDIDKMGLSLIADLGFNYALGQHWGLYFGLYAGYGIMNLNEEPSAKPMLSTPNGTTTTYEYNGVIGSNQVDELHYLNAGLKLGINLGWSCHSTAEPDNDNALVSYDNKKSGQNAQSSQDDNAKPVIQKAKDAAADTDKNNPDTQDNTADRVLQKTKDAAADTDKNNPDTQDNTADRVLQKTKDAAADTDKNKPDAQGNTADRVLQKTKDAAADTDKNNPDAQDNTADRVLQKAKDAAADTDKNKPDTQDNTADRVLQKAKDAAKDANDYEDAQAAEEAAAREARCDARRMNNPDMAQALADIDNDIAEAEQVANESGSADAKAAVADAKAKAADAKAAHKAGKYCKAYDLFNEAYGFIADSYAADAHSYANAINNDIANQAAADADLYAEASHKDGLDCAMAASRNARINSDIARDADNENRGIDSNDPKVASRLADDAIAMAKNSGSKPAMTDAKDASGKAYRGNLADSYAAAAKSFSESAEGCAAKSGTAESKAAVAEAKAAAAAAVLAARNGKTDEAYRAAIQARSAAQRACGVNAAPDGESAKPTKQGKKDKPAKTADKKNLPTDRAGLQNLLDQINATVHFDFGKTEPQFDSKTDLAIEALCQAMAADSRVKVLITGHTDNVGSSESNMTYGKRRAEALKELMVNRGAPASSISTASRGEDEPVVENDTDEHRYQNRRAVITLR